MRNDMKSKRYFDNLINSFKLFVRLWMINRECQYYYVHFRNDNESKVEHEFDIFVVNNSSWHISIMIDKNDDYYVNSCCRISNVFIDNEQNSFNKFANDNEQNIVFVFRDK